MDVVVEFHDRLSEPDIQRIGVLISRVTDADEVRPVSEHVWLHIRHGGDEADQHLIVRRNDEIVGYAHLDQTDLVEGPSAELAVDPSARQQGIGTALVQAMIDVVPGGHLRLWSHGELAVSGQLALGMGFTQARILWQMRRSLFAPLPRLEIPAGVTIRAFQPGVDDDEWIALNAAAFANLPDQGAWTRTDLGQRLAEPWFDPNGFLIAERNGRMIGFHWTKLHGGDAHDPIGEVYVLGIDPSERGTGLGRVLTLAGLHYLRSLQLAQVMLYVDATNTAAIGVYEGLGFTRWDTDVMYRR